EEPAAARHAHRPPLSCGGDQPAGGAFWCGGGFRGWRPAPGRGGYLMPYGIRKRDSKWVVVKLAEGRQPERTMGVHDTRQAAEAQRRALYAAERRVVRR